MKVLAAILAMLMVVVASHASPAATLPKEVDNALNSSKQVVLYSLAGKISRVQIGMSQAQVVEVMGKPASTSRKGDVEYMNYALSDTGDQAFYGVTRPYYVRLVNGRVDSYGHTGDFDSTKDPTININTAGSTGQKDLYTELTKLKALLDSGAITQEEYDAQKKKILSH